MESILQYVCENAHQAHWILFVLILLTGLNLPISEDLLLITAGAISSTCIPDHTLHMFMWVYAAGLLSAWEAYWIGRYFGPRLYELHWFQRVITPERIEKLHGYYEKFGVFTFIVGRFCPGGVRNALFMSSGLGKMPFLKFIARDWFAGSISISTIFYLGFLFGSNYQTIINQMKKYDEIAIMVIIALICLVSVYLYFRCKKRMAK